MSQLKKTGREGKVLISAEMGSFLCDECDECWGLGDLLFCHEGERNRKRKRRMRISSFRGLS